jgi:hypothetical protein
MPPGLTDEGRPDAGAQQLRVLNMRDRYVLHTPPGAGALLHHLEVLSTLGVEETLRLLNTLEPLQEC